MTALAADLGGTRIKLGLVRDGEVLGQRFLEAHSEAPFEERLPGIEEGLRSLCAEAVVSPGACVGLGLLSTGLVDARANRILSTNRKFAGAERFDIEAWSRRALGIPARVENDAHGALLGEWKHGAGRGRNDIVMITLGTGIGTSAILGGRPLRGRQGRAGLLGGHIMMDPDGPPCTCPSRGCAEALASGWSLPLRLAERAGFKGSPSPQSPPPDFESLFRLADRGDAAARDMVDRCLSVWSAVAITLIHLFAPELVIIGGGVARRADRVLPAIRERADRHAWTGGETVEFAAALHPDTAGLLGAETLFHGDLEFL